MDIKDLFNEQTVGDLADGIQVAYGGFDREAFLARVFDAEWPARELKQRIRHITVVLHELLRQTIDPGSTSCGGPCLTWRASSNGSLPTV